MDLGVPREKRWRGLRAAKALQTQSMSRERATEDKDLRKRAGTPG